MINKTDTVRTDARSRRTVIIVAVAVLALAAFASWRVRSSSVPEEIVVAALTVAPSATDTLAALVAHGRRVYEGKAGGALCTTCHGPQAKGVAGIGPDLTDGTWLHGDGSVEFIRTVIRSGVTKPKLTAAIMPPYGGSPLKPDQLEALATYVHSLNAASR